MGEVILTDEVQVFKFKAQNKALVFIDGNYMINISRALSLKIDMENLIDDLSKEFFRHKTYWYSALESNLDRSNSAFRFLDRLQYIPRTKVYVGRMGKDAQGHFDTALKTDAGIALSIGMVEQAMLKSCDYILLVAGDSKYTPAIKSAQQYGCIVRLIVPKQLGDLRPHHELVKTADELFEMSSEYLYGFEYGTDTQYYEEDGKDKLVQDDKIDETKDDIEELEDTMEVEIKNDD